MNKLQRIKKEKEIYEQYHVPGNNDFVRRPKNAVFINVSNNIKHEIKKLEVCYELLSTGCNFVTEAVRNKKVNGKNKRVDIVDISTGKEIEIIYKHETEKQVEEYRKEGVIPIYAEPPKICRVCKKEYRSFKDDSKYCSRKCKQKRQAIEMRKYEFTDLICDYCGKIFGKGTLYPTRRKTCSEECRRKLTAQKKTGFKFSEKTKRKMSEDRKGDKNSNWKGGVKEDGNGYLLVYSPEHPNKINNRYVFFHRLVMEKSLGRYLTTEEIVHHKNGDKKDNRIENLELMSQSKHMIKYVHRKSRQKSIEKMA